MSSQYANKLREVAFTSDIYDGLTQSFDQFPGLCEGPATILRGLKGLTHFTLVVSEDGAGFEYADDEDHEDGEDDDRDEADGVGEDENVDDTQDITQADEIDASGSNTGVSNAEPELGDQGEPDDALDDDTIVRQFLDRLDEEAMETMSKGI